MPGGGTVSRCVPLEKQGVGNGAGQREMATRGGKGMAGKTSAYRQVVVVGGKLISMFVTDVGTIAPVVLVADGTLVLRDLPSAWL